MIDAGVLHLPQVERGFLTIFSARPLPGADLILERLREEMGCNGYRGLEMGLDG
jgi:hypothetical protein